MRWINVIGLGLFVALAGFPATRGHGSDYDWQRDKGQTIHFLVNNNSLGQALVGKAPEFEKLTGITVKVDMYQEQQMRQRLLTVLNAKSSEIDVFMTLPSREGEQFAAAGWLTDLSDLVAKAAPDYNFGDISKKLIEASTFSGKLTSLPVNIEGPVLYWRTDIFKKCGVEAPRELSQLLLAAKKIKECDSQITPFVSRGLKPAISYTFSNFLHNLGGHYTKDGKVNLCGPVHKEAYELYSSLLRDYGPPGVSNYSFLQIAALYSAGRAAMAFESSGQMVFISKTPARPKDTGVMLLPPGPAGSIPTAISWNLAISPFSAKRDAAWLFVQWASGPALQKELSLAAIPSPRGSPGNSAEYKEWLDEVPLRGQWQQALDKMRASGSSELGLPIVANGESRDYIGAPVVDLVLGQRPFQDSCKLATQNLEELIHRQ
ncbi:MAG: extracellular solute-binding protein [Proteobacteria bacterium]|nr:extracellular solute-binding protein [Pseudomonadota bacterium]